MILLDDYHQIIVEALSSRLPNPEKFSLVASEKQEKKDSLDVHFADFDEVQYHLSCAGGNNKKYCLSMKIKCFPELKNYNAIGFLKSIYGGYLKDSAEAGYDVSLEFDLEELPKGQEAEIIHKFSMLKRNALAAPFLAAFDAVLSGGSSPLITLPYRSQGESIWIQAHPDRVTVIFSTLFRDPTDVVLGRVFLQEFVDARKSPQLQNAPPVLLSFGAPPLELKGVVNEKSAENVSFVTFVLFPRHFKEGQLRENVLSHIQSFRDYLHYHIKCSKAYLHCRMRSKVNEFLKVLNRAKPDLSATAEKKLASGKTFKRQ